MIHSLFFRRCTIFPGNKAWVNNTVAVVFKPSVYFETFLIFDQADNA